MTSYRDWADDLEGGMGLNLSSFRNCKGDFNYLKNPERGEMIIKSEHL
jgi:hypothetical protein